MWVNSKNECHKTPHLTSILKLGHERCVMTCGEASGAGAQRPNNRGSKLRISPKEKPNGSSKLSRLLFPARKLATSWGIRKVGKRLANPPSPLFRLIHIGNCFLLIQTIDLARSVLSTADSCQTTLFYLTFH